MSGFFAAQIHAQTSTVLGGMNLDGYCTSIGQGRATLQSNVWNCTGNNQPIALNSACVWQYNVANAFAQETATNNPYSYVCYAGAVTATPTPTAVPTPTVIPTPTITPTPTTAPLPTPTPTLTPTSAPTPTPTPAGTPINLGGMNLDGYCGSLGLGGSVLSGTTWDCTGNKQPITLNSACVWQYNIANAYAQEIRTNDPYSWNCFSNAQTTITPTPTPIGTVTDLGGMTLDQYCQSINNGVGYSFLNPNNQWACTASGQVINLNVACVWQYKFTNAYAQERTPGNVYTYDCFVAGPGITATPTPTAAPTPTPTPSPVLNTTDDWTTYKYDAMRGGYNNAETTINGTTAANLKQILDILPATPSAVISDQPAVVNNVIYYGDWTGTFYARDLTGNVIWSKNLGVDTPPAANNCSPKSLGVVSSPSVQTITINGVQTPIVYISGADGFMYALYASNGNVLWKTQLTDPKTGGLLWDSPAEYNGSVYIGLASFGDCPLVQGKIFKLDQTTGALQATAKLVPDGCVGAGSWSSPTIDEANNKMYVATGTQDNSCKVNGQAFVEPYALALVELDLTNLNILGSWRIPKAEQGPDSDFGISPTLTTGIVNGVTTQLVSGVNKNGHLYIFKRDNLTAGPLQDLTLATGGGGTCPDCSMGSISSSATDGTTLYQAMGQCSVTTTFNCAGTGLNTIVFAINPTNGAIIWQHPVAHAVVGSLTLLNGVLIVPEGNHIDLLNPSNGNQILQLTPTGAHSVFDAPVAVARGKLFAGDLNGNFYSFGL